MHILHGIDEIKKILGISKNRGAYRDLFKRYERLGLLVDEFSDKSGYCLIVHIPKPQEESQRKQEIIRRISNTAKEVSHKHNLESSIELDYVIGKKLAVFVRLRNSD